ncbi:MAG: Na(+)-translocating NADH-quinone reductase subunit C [Myxococcales bacterium]|jgi:Na+-transporting NADH:ubiquinone oxidoreductase subunit C|nr:Na(+)-translocating NADH-quinone reductase subunit C [Myxococcales bacterium]
MSRKQGAAYTLGFSALVCLVCSVFVSFSNVSLKERQELNRQVDKQKNVLVAAGLATSDEKLSSEEIVARFQSIVPVAVALRDPNQPKGEERKPGSGAVLSDVDATAVDMVAAMQDENASLREPANKAGILRVPYVGVVYQVMEGDRVARLVLPISGKGLWSTMYGFMAIAADTTTIKGVSFYDHGETAGLGGEIENPSWTARWHDRRLFDDAWQPIFAVRKGATGSVAEDPHGVDGLSGATLTSNGVTESVRFWVGEYGYGPYLKAFREGGR